MEMTGFRMRQNGVGVSARRIVTAVFLAVFLAGIAAASPFEDFVYKGKETGKLITAYRYFRNISDAAGGISVVSSPLFKDGDTFLLPAYYAEGKTVKKRVQDFCRLFPVYRFRFSRRILNIYPIESLEGVYGTGRLLPPGQWLTAGDALSGGDSIGIWEPVSGHSATNFTIPLFRKIGDNADDAVEAFCDFFPAYEYKRRGKKYYIFPQGEWPRVAKKYKEPLVEAENGLTLVTGLGSYLHAGYIFRFGRFFVEPRVGLGFVDYKDADSGVVLSPSFSVAFNPIFLEAARWYTGVRLLAMVDVTGEDSVVQLALFSGFEFYNALGEIAALVDDGKLVFRIGAGWRF